MMSDFHFIRPLWLLAFIGLFLVLFVIKKLSVSRSGWRSVLPKHLSNTLLTNTSSNHKKQGLLIPLLIGSLLILALAGPAWQKLPQPIFNIERGSVIVLDMSHSMYATDLAPNRLTQARFKVLDLLEQLNEGDVGLIAYAGDAFVISPLTRDVNNIKILLPSLSPDIMPEPGSNAIAALTLASDMLVNAGHTNGDVFWFTDDLDFDETPDVNDWLNQHQHRLNILGVGTREGAPIKLPNGELLKDRRGEIVIPSLPENRLSAIAKQGRGTYVQLRTDDLDIETLAQPDRREIDSTEEESHSFGDQWQEFGPYLLLVAIPFLLTYFRRGLLLSTLLVTPLLSLTPNSAHASIWNDLWQTPDQQASKKFEQQQYQAAAKQFDNNMWQGSAHYRAGEFELAVDAFNQVDTAEGHYNRGNALAKLGKLEEAIDAYDSALSRQQDHQDAAANKALLEQMKQQQQQQQNQNNNQEQEQQDSQEQENQEQQEPDDQQGQGDNQQDQQQNKDSNDQQEQEESDSSSQAEEQDEEQPQSQEQQSKEEQKQQQDKQEQTAAEAKADEQKQSEQDQKIQQLLNKVTDDPYLLLRNKMQLEYRKRQQYQSRPGATKKW